MAARSDAERRVAFLLRCADAYALASPEAARHFAQRARELANERGLRLDEATRAAFCAHCSTALVPGVNCAVRVTAKWRDDPSVRRATRGAARPAASRQPRPGTVNLVVGDSPLARSLAHAATPRRR
jgi:RNase P subunit RPR2